ncbi:MAG: hypothetical protein WC047_03075 [Kiritimatiellales bacterium]
MKKIIFAGYILFFESLCLGAGISDKAFIYAVHKGAQAMMTFRVVDDEGLSVTDANIETGFDDPSPGQSIYNWQTDTNGICVVNGKTKGNMWYRITKPGFYQTDGSFYFRSKNPPYVVDGRWNPWNPTNTVILKAIKDPVPMYVKGVEALIPVLNKPVGFDLEKGDWVSPYGGGARSDFLITFSKEQRVKNDYDLNITLDFSNQRDGIQEVDIENPKVSDLRMPYDAPLSGYQTNWLSRAGQRPDTGYFGTLVSDETKNYFYRVRTVLDENGNIKETYYGKIHGAIHLRSAFRDDPKIIFTYYLNPTPNDRNVEFDPEKNLFGGTFHFAP